MIDGVKFKIIKNNIDRRGFFREIFKQKDAYQNKIKFVQISHSFIKRNIIKAWHLHKKQYQWNYLVNGKIKVHLFDIRKSSKTYKKHVSFLIDSKKDHFVYFFPPGVAHGYITKKRENNMIYATSGYYNIKEEEKIPLNNKLIPNFFDE
tara:strand:+ start:304 stop:750 length:447 start_codon:yes stop_codon:yes gene_type:complete